MSVCNHFCTLGQRKLFTVSRFWKLEEGIVRDVWSNSLNGENLFIRDEILLILCFACVLSGSETALVPLPGVSFDQLFLHLIEGTAQVRDKCQYYKYDVDILRGEDILSSLKL